MEKIYMPIENFTTQTRAIIPKMGTMKHLKWDTMQLQLRLILRKFLMLHGEKVWFVNFTKQVIVTLLTILDSFLTNRYSWNLVNGYISEWFESDFGLPQRSILIPVPFVVFSGDISADRVKSTYNFQTDPLNIHQINPNMLTTTHG